MLTVGKIEQLTNNPIPLITQKPTYSCTGPSDCSPNRVPESDRNMIFHVCQKLAVVLGLNAQEQAWLESLGANFSKANSVIDRSSPNA